MRPLIAAVSCLLAVLLATLGICDEPAKQPDISFEIPCECSKPDANETFGIGRKGLCLRGSYRAGLPVVLVSEAGVFHKKTAESPTNADACRSLDGVGKTYLVGSEAYLASPNMGLIISHYPYLPIVAILGADSAAVRHWPPRKDPWGFITQCGGSGFFGEPEQPFWVPVSLFAWINASPFKGILPPKVLTLGGSAVLSGDPMGYFLNNRPFSISDELELYNLVFSIDDRVYLMRETTDWKEVPPYTSACHVRFYPHNELRILDLSGREHEILY